MNYWDKMFGELQVRATQLGDRQGNALARALILVPKKVRWTVLREYVDRCQELHAIAFLQWRLEYPNDVRHDPDELVELIEKRIQMFNKNLGHKHMTSISEETKA